MRRVTYQTIAHGALGDPVEASLQDFLLHIPYLLVPPGPIPPLFVLNDLLAKGVVDMGMSGGCQWEPLQITPVEWEELASALARTRGLVVVEPAAWVRTYSDWSLWSAATKLGVPLDEQLELKALWDEEERWRQESEKAGRDGDRDRMLECFEKAVDAGMRASEIMNRYNPSVRRESTQ
jgi:hypothetical protein